MNVRLLTALSVKPDCDLPIGSTRRASQLALVLVVDSVASTHRPRASVVSIGRTARRTFTGGRESVDRGATPRPVWTLLIAAWILHLCGEDVATCAQFTKQHDKSDSKLHFESPSLISRYVIMETHLVTSLTFWLHVRHCT
jgi:hypothetical protein